MKRSVAKHAWVFMALAILALAAYENTNQPKQEESSVSAKTDATTSSKDCEVQELNDTSVLRLVVNHLYYFCVGGSLQGFPERELAAESQANLAVSNFVLGMESLDVAIEGDIAIVRCGTAFSRAAAWIDNESLPGNDFLAILRRDPTGTWRVVEIRLEGGASMRSPEDDIDGGIFTG